VIARHKDGHYQPLSGNEIGVALAYYLLTENLTVERPLVMTTIVSSSLLKKMASELYAGYAETLTGYKWIANTAIDLRREKGYTFVFGYEEALGYTVSELVRDKDGIGAALVFSDLAAFCASRGETVLDWVEAIYRRFGLHLNGAKSVTLPGSEGALRIGQMMEQMRDTPPAEIGGIQVAARGDLLTGLRKDRHTGEETRLEFPESNVLVFELEDGSRVLVRPSGTEPKIKFYFEVVQPVAEDEPFADAEDRAKQHLEGLMDAFLSNLGTGS
jgi:phosphomannomutase